MGIETISAEPAEVQFIVGLPRSQFRAALCGHAKHLANLCRLHGLRLSRLDDGQNMHIGVEHPRNATVEQRAAVAKALADIAKHFGIEANSVSPAQVAAGKSRANTAINKSNEWREFAACDVKLLEGTHAVPGFKAVAIMPSKCTFAEETLTELRLQTGLAEEDFVQFPSYRGMAVHSYESYRTKVAKEKPPQPTNPVNLKLPE